jgi:hypothetical protein
MTHDLPESVQKLINNLRKEAKDYRHQRTAARAAASDARREAAGYRIKLRAAEARIAELEARIK